MNLSSDLISQFVKITNDEEKPKTGSTAYGNIVIYNGKPHVQLDGSDLLTPVNRTTDVEDGERVMVTIENHTATVTGNMSSPSARTDAVKDVDKKVDEIGNQISEFEIVIADKVDTKQLAAESARIDELRADNVTIKKTLTAYEADITNLKAEDAEISGKLEANEAEIETLRTNKLDANVADLKYAEIDDLEATNADIHNLEVTYGEFANLATNKFTALEADIKNADLKYANIDFSNIGKAAFEYFYANSGLIDNVVVGDGTITGNLVGVTIKGDLIEGNTIVADKLVIKGDDGLYYKLNTNGVTTETEQTEYNSLSGSIITAKSITATKIAVDDLVAFDATIGGFKITDNAIYSGVKESIDNTTRGIYMDNDGQVVFGDSNSYIKYYKDTDGIYKLAISAGSITMRSSGKTVDDTLKDLENRLDEEVNTLKDEISTLLRIESSRGTVFKNDQVATVLSAVIYRGSQCIRDIDSLKAAMGSSAYLQWSWQRLDEDSYGLISADDERLGNSGFTFTLSPDDVDTKVTFKCELID